MRRAIVPFSEHFEVGSATVLLSDGLRLSQPVLVSGVSIAVFGGCTSVSLAGSVQYCCFISVSHVSL